MHETSDAALPPAIGRAVAVLGLAAATLLGPLPAAAWIPPPPASATAGDEAPRPAFAIPENSRIRRVDIRVGDVFDDQDPEEDRRIFHLVNRLHRNTRDWVIRQQLLFAPGDPYAPRLLEESERLLRRNRYLYDAEIVPVAVDGDQVDLEVRTRDVWTLTGGARFARSGGENRTQLEIQDFNFMGTGKEIAISRTSDFERNSNELLYRDFNLAGRRAEMELSLRDNSDGERYLLHLRRPFFALATRWSAGLTVVTEDRVDPLFTRGQVREEFRHRIDVYEGHWGFSRGLVEGVTRRWKLGFTHIADRFSAAPGREPPLGLPPDRTLSYPWVDFELVEDRFIEAHDLDQMARTEDVRLGRRLQGRLGWSSPAWGGDRDLAVFGTNASLGLRPAPGRLILTSASLGGRWGSDGFEVLATGAGARFLWRNWGKHLFLARLQLDLVENLDPELQLTLGGDSGLRGYPLRFQEGDRRFLLTIEQRFFTEREIFQLANVGAAAFVDVGRAWFVGADRSDDLGVLTDVGFGLRVAPSRSGRGTMVHLDVAFPLDRDGTFESVQWLVTSKETF